MAAMADLRFSGTAARASGAQAEEELGMREMAGRVTSWLVSNWQSTPKRCAWHETQPEASQLLTQSKLAMN